MPAKESAAKGKTTAVEIFGSVYYVRGENDSDSLRELAGIVDGQMRQIAEQVATVDPAKIAILTALNLADELSQCQKLQEGERVEVREKAAALVGKLEQALES